MKAPDETLCSCGALAMLLAEHRRLEGLFEEYIGASLEEHREALLRDICDLVRLHLTTETGVLVPALAEAMGDPAVLNRAGAEYAVIMSLTNECNRPDSWGHDLDLQVLQLRQRVLEHIAAAEGVSGSFARAERLPMDWETIEILLLTRRRELAHRVI